jgi:hypothetical protein
MAAALDGWREKGLEVRQLAEDVESDWERGRS